MKSTLEMARKAGIDDPASDWMFWNAMERFAELIRADERNSWPAEMEAMERQVNILTDALAQSRKPLTDEDLIECERLAGIRHRIHMGSIRGQQLSPADQLLWHYARAIEAAHGIKENK